MIDVPDEITAEWTKTKLTYKIFVKQTMTMHRFKYEQ